MVLVTDIEQLRKVTELVKETDDILKVADDLFREMVEFHAQGLAANQLGYDLKIFVMERNKGVPTCIVNPVIVKTKGWYEANEICSSLPGVSVRVKRPKEIRVRGVNQYFMPVNYKFKGIEARRACHEIDHLIGKLITDYQTEEE